MNGKKKEKFEINLRHLLNGLKPKRKYKLKAQKKEKVNSYQAPQSLDKTILTRIRNNFVDMHMDTIVIIMYHHLVRLNYSIFHFISTYIIITTINGHETNGNFFI